MPAFPLAVSTTAALLLASGVALAQPATATRSLPSQRLLERHGLVRMWWGQAQMNTARDTVLHLVADEQIVMVHSSGGLLSAFEAETGRRLWAAQIGPQDTPAYAPVANDQLVLVAAGVRLYALDKWTGDPVWNVVIPGHPSASPAIDEDEVYVGCLDGSVYAFDLKRIRELYEQALLPQWSHLTVVWRHATSGRISAPPVPTGATVKFASHNRSLYSLTRNQHSVKFQLETGAAVAAPLAYRPGPPGTIFLASEDFKLYAVNSDNGRLRWEPYVSGLPIRRAPRVLRDAVYVFPDRGGMHAVSVEDGRQLWWRPRIVDFISGSRTRLYTTDDLGHVVVMDRADGAPLGVLPLRDLSLRFSNDRTDRLFLSTPSGLVVALREAGLDFPVYHLFPERRPILPEFAPEEEAAAEVDEAQPPQ
ncbi:MAG TPA: PQQ-binding-like beta-propeller repeat protein [Planctomycetaceae bacterium]|nr:PQQ-binding-like beta-propeller repeat protein [Planctomycetaceae bacterium]